MVIIRLIAFLSAISLGLNALGSLISLDLSGFLGQMFVAIIVWQIAKHL